MMQGYKRLAHGNDPAVATVRELPPDVAAAFDEVPAAGERFAALPAQRQGEWLAWLDRGRGGRARQRRLDEMVRRLAPAGGAATEEEVAEPPPPPPPTREWWPWLLLLLLLVVGGLIAWWLLTRGNDRTTVPNVIGLRQQVAETRIHNADLKVLTAQGASARPQGVVFKQRPGAGTRLDEGRTVTITISSGPARAAVPDVVGLTQQAAVTKLTNAGFDPKVKRVASTKQKNTVVDQAPLPGVTALNGSTVNVSVSSGKRPVVVPTVVGLKQNAAVQKLTALGLVPQIQNAPSTRPKGTVFAQKPPSGKEVDKGSKVTINVSSGSGAPGTTTTTTTGTTTTTATTATTATTVTTGATAARVTVPNVRGLAVVAGLRRLNAARLRPTVRYVSSTQRTGSIVAQIPSGGTLRRGSRVRLNVSTGPNPAATATVPNVVGQDQAAAATTVRQAGFRVVILFRPTTDQSQDGIVIEEQPPAGSSIPRGSSVALFVGAFSG
jgi:beta-lactam-binding protein with PASTA domain